MCIREIIKILMITLQGKITALSFYKLKFIRCTLRNKDNTVYKERSKFKHVPNFSYRVAALLKKQKEVQSKSEFEFIFLCRFEEVSCNYFSYFDDFQNIQCFYILYLYLFLTKYIHTFFSYIRFSNDK